MLEVTHRCPCDCIHCLLAKKYEDELAIDEISDLFRQLREEGTFNIGISGGEPFLREDLPVILEEARKNGFIISILTTGITIEHAEITLIKKLNISRIEISLLGANPETHDSVMRHKGAFNRMLKAAKQMHSEGVNIIMKGTILKQNYAELDDMARLCDSLGLPFLANVVISPRTDGDTHTQDNMLSADECALLDPVHINGGLIPDENTDGGAILSCKAGITSACISPQGDVFPCVIMRKKIGAIRKNSIKEIWHDNPDPFVIGLRSAKPEDATRCFSCESRAHCKRCPGTSFLETGSVFGVPTSFCRLAGKI